MNIFTSWQELTVALLLGSLHFTSAGGNNTFGVVGTLAAVDGNEDAGYGCNGKGQTSHVIVPFTYDFSFNGVAVSSNMIGCCGMYSPDAGPVITAELAGGESVLSLLQLTVGGDLCTAHFSLAGVPSCFDVTTERFPKALFPGSGISTVTWETHLKRNSNSVPVATWSVKNKTGTPVREVPVEGHRQLVADGMSAAIATVINTEEDPTFQFTGDSLGCTLADTVNGTVLTAGTNFGTVQVTAMLTDSDPCLERDFYFDLLPPCSACVAGCPPGSVTARQGSVDVLIGLGSGRSGLSQAYLQVKSEAPTLDLGTPALLRCNSIQPDLQKITNAAGWLRQIRVMDGFMDILTNSPFSYSIDFHSRTNLTGLTNGLYTFTNSPDRSVTIALVGGDTNHVRITESEGLKVTDYHWETTGWALETGAGLRRETKLVSVSGDKRTEATTIKPTGGSVERQSVEIWQTNSFGDRLIEEVFGSGSTARTNTYSYHTNGLLEQVARWDGSWDIYDYDSAGRQVEHYSSFLNAAPTTNALLCRRTSSTYDNSVVSGSGDDAAFGLYTPRRVIDYVQGVEVSRRYTVVKEDEHQEILCPNPGAEWNDSANQVTTTYFRTDSAHYGRPAVITHPDGTAQFVTYATMALPGTIAPTYEKTTVRSGEPNGAITDIVDGTQEETWADKAGRTLYRQTSDIESGLLTGREVYSRDEDGRVTFITYLDGTVESRTYDCCRLLSVTDRAGTVTSYTHDALDRQLTLTRDGITTSNVWNSAGDPLEQHRFGTNGHSIRLNASGYDTSGRLRSVTNALDEVTQYAEEVNPSGHLVRATTNTDGSTVIDTYTRDGALLKRDGTAVFAARYTNGVVSLGGRNRFYSQEIRLLTNGNDSAEYIRSIQDGLGRTIQTEFPGGATNTVIYNAAGQVKSTVDADGVTTLYDYNNLGELEYVAVDLDQDGVIDLDGTDRVTRTETDVAHSVTYNADVRLTRTYVYATDNDATATLLSERADSLYDDRIWMTTDGLTRSSMLTYLGGGTTRLTRGMPDGTQVVERFRSSRPLSLIVSNATEGVLREETYGYDAHNRRNSLTDPRTGTTSFVFDDLDRVLSVTTPVPATGQPAQVTTLVYDDAGRVERSQAPDGLWTTNEFHLKGPIRKVTGTRVYPVEYSYDYAGRLKTLKTWQDYAANSGTATSTWEYDDRGLLTNKLDAAGQGPSYTYTAAGRVATRTWARGASTSYAYNNAGDLEGIDYSDDTPDVDHAYDRLGRPSHIEGSTTNDYKFTTHGLLLAEDSVNTSWNYTSQGRFGYDTLRRRSALTNLTLSLTHRYTHDPASRLDTVSTVDSGLTALARYSYVSNSPLLDTVSFERAGTPRLATVRTYDNLNRLTAIGSSSSWFSSSSSYRYNQANQRTGMTNADASYWLYAYDRLGQVTSGRHYWDGGSNVLGQTFDYAFDDIGNRKRTETGSDDVASSLRLATYSATLLNEYTDRTVPGYVEVSGTATNTATVKVNGLPASRQGEYFRREVPVNNISSALVQWLTSVATNTNGTTTVARLTYVPESPEAFAYDADGNLTSDGLWNYTWDAENRLTTVELQTNTITDSAYWQRIECDYDHLSRRIRKRVLAWNPSTLNHQLATSLRYFYDGWNLVGQVDEVTGRRLSFLWGSDLSGTLQGAGGVGGLLTMTVHNGSEAGTYFYAYDGNGNAVALIDAGDGSEAARYEYGPFGELIRSTGPLANLNPFRFSTKYQDEETGLIYYGYRYYNANLGRWLSKDPIGHAGGVNLYGFVANHPVSGVDPLGLALYAFDGTGQTYESGTAIAILAGSYDGEVEYETGVGTGGVISRAAGGITGIGGRNRLESMYRKFLANYEAGDTDVDIIGFSRGAALAREFANMLNERGYQKTKKTRRGDRPVGEMCPVKIRFVGLFDTVGSFGIPGNYVNLGVDLELPPSVKNAAHAVAEDEKRALFPYSPLNAPRQGQNFVERSFPGDHSDIGSGHGTDNNLLSQAPLRFVSAQGRSAGAPFLPLPDRNLVNSRTPHDLRGPSFNVMTHLLYNLSPSVVALRGGFTSPTQQRNLP